MLEHKVLYTSDIHGDVKQLNELARYALKIRPGKIILKKRRNQAKCKRGRMES